MTFGYYFIHKIFKLIFFNLKAINKIITFVKYNYKLYINNFKLIIFLFKLFIFSLF